MVTFFSIEAMSSALEDSSNPSMHSLFNVSAAELYPKRGLRENSISEENTPESEPLSEPFVPVYGESIEYLSRCNNGGILALSNYRLYLQREDCSYNIPIVLIEQVEVRDLFYLHILCKDAQSLRCSFSTGEACAEWQRRVIRATTPPRDLESVFALAFFAWANEEADDDAWYRLGGRSEGPTSPALVGSVEASEQHFRTEVERLGFDTQGAWRVSKLNGEYGLCPSYPRLLLLPACISDEGLEAVARFRSARRVPAVVWRHVGNGAVLARCSQPEVGWLGWRSAEDEDLIRAIADACAYDAGTDVNPLVGLEDRLGDAADGLDLVDEPQRHPRAKSVLIVDARSYTTAVANRARGGGCECPEYYPRCDITFMNLANIHAVRKSAQALRTLCAAESADQLNWFSLLEGSRWFQLVSGLIRAAVTVAAAMEREARPVLVHCSDGWDRTPQIVALSQLLLDPHYRTIEGFQLLVEREWLDFGHKFGDRCGLGAGASEDANERSPVFLQWLDCVHQLLHQFPCAFQFSHAFLVRLAQHVYSSLFGTFLCNSQHERARLRVAERTLSVWRFLRANPACHNLLYAANQQVLWPSYSVRDLRLWSEVYLGGGGLVRSLPSSSTTREEPSSSPASATPLSSATPSPATPGSEPGISKTRSCEDLSSAVPVACHARRSSHPSLTDSTLASLMNGIQNETDSVFVNGHCEDEEKKLSENIINYDFVDATVPISHSITPSNTVPEPPPLPPPSTQSVESSTDTLVPTEQTNQQIIYEEKATTSNNVDNNHQLPVASCHVCASSRKFLLESSVLELCNNGSTSVAPQTRASSHYSTPTSYPATPGSDCCLTSEEEALLRPMMKANAMMSNQSLQGKLEVDGLASLHSDIQTRLQHIFSDFQSQVDALQRELHTTRLALIQQVCHHCGPGHSNGEHRADDTGSLPESVDSLADTHGAVINSRPASDVSWETVEEKDALPTLWMPDHAVTRCMGCDTEFWLGRRKHHCRSCGQIFCADCSWNTAPLPSEQLYEPVRVCATCYRSISLSPPPIHNNTNGNTLNGNTLTNGTSHNIPSSQQNCKQPSPHDKLHKPIVSTAST